MTEAREEPRRILKHMIERAPARAVLHARLSSRMPKQPPHKIEYSAEAREHLRELDARDRAVVVDNVERKLKHEPTEATRNKKLLRANELASWELRIGEWRVYHDVQETLDGIVTVRAVGRKDGARVLIAGVEYKL